MSDHDKAKMIIERNGRREQAIIYIQKNPVIGTFIEELRMKTFFGKFTRINFSVNPELFNDIFIRFFFRVNIYPIDREGSSIKVINYNYSVRLEDLKYESCRNYFYNNFDHVINEHVIKYSVNNTFESLTFKPDTNPIEMF